MTHINQDLAKVSFHEATLVGICHQGDAVDLKLDDVLIAGVRKPASVTLKGVCSISREGTPIKDLHMEEEDGEILTLHEDNNQITLVVQWNNFATRHQSTVIYTMPGGRILLHVIP